MKKLVATIITLTILAMMALPAAAQTRSRNYSRTYYGNRYDDRIARRSERRAERRAQRINQNNVYYDDSYDYGYGRDRSVWEKHRDKITTAGAQLEARFSAG